MTEFSPLLVERMEQLSKRNKKDLTIKPCTFISTKEYGSPADWDTPPTEIYGQLDWVSRNACIKDGFIYSRFPSKDEIGFYMEWVKGKPVTEEKFDVWFSGGFHNWPDHVRESIDKYHQEFDPAYKALREEQRQAQMKKMVGLFADVQEIMTGEKQKVIFDTQRGEWASKPVIEPPEEVGLGVGDRELIKDWFSAGQSRKNIVCDFGDEFADLVRIYIKELEKDSKVMAERSEAIRREAKYEQENRERAMLEAEYLTGKVATTNLSMEEWIKQELKKRRGEQ